MARKSVKRTTAQYDFLKLLFNERWLSKHYTSQRAGHKRYVVAHHSTIVGTGNGGALENMYGVWLNRPASAHYGVDGALIWQYVYDKDYAWSTGSTAGNRDGISIEHMNSTREPSWRVAELTWKTGAKLAAAICLNQGFGRPTSNDTGTTGNIRQHKSFVGTACPGPFMSAKAQWRAYVAEAQRQYDILLALKKGGTPVVTPPVVVEPEAPISGVTYVVQPGDTLWSLARRSDTTVDQLVAWNGIKDASVLTPGQQLVLTKPATPSSPATYTVKRRDTLGKIAEKYGLTLEQIVEWNAIRDPNVIGVGQVLRLTKPSSPPVITDPKPPSRNPKLDISFFYQNVAGYNGPTARGVTQWRKNVDGTAKAALSTKPDLIGFVELSDRAINKMLPRMISALKGYGRAVGLAGRNWFRRDGEVGIAHSGTYSVKSKLNGDTKEMAWIHFKPVGVDAYGIAGVFHGEHENGRDKKSGKSGDAIRVEQAVECWNYLMARAREHGVDEENVWLFGDFNSESWVREALGKLGVKTLASSFFLGWGKKSKKRLNYIFGKGSLTGATRRDTGYSDHEGISGALPLKTKETK